MTDLRRIGIIANLAKPHAQATVEKLAAWLRAQKREVVGLAALQPLLHRTYRQVADAELGRSCDLLVVLGGDGTLLAAARTVAGSGTPILGVNLGALGFLTEVRDRELFGAMESVLHGDYETEPRTMLEAAVRRSEAAQALGLALNDAVVHAGTSSRLLDLGVVIDGQVVGEIRADGMIVSTPTGSTAYSLSAGGPLVRPTIPALVLTSICPHSLSVRPLVFDDRETIEIRVGPPHTSAYVALDGQVALEFDPPATVQVCKAPVETRIVLPQGRSFYRLVGTKLHWGGLAAERQRE